MHLHHCDVTRLNHCDGQMTSHSRAQLVGLHRHQPYFSTLISCQCIVRIFLTMSSLHQSQPAFLVTQAYGGAASHLSTLVPVWRDVHWIAYPHPHPHPLLF